MGNFDNLEIVEEFTNNGRVYGIYIANFQGKRKIFIRNNDSIGVVYYYYDKPAGKCVSEIRDDVKKEFLHYLNQ